MSGIKVFVGSLPQGTTDQTLTEYFSQYGTVVQCIVKSEQRYGFVFYTTMQEAQEAITELNGFPMEGSTLVVKLADKQQQGSPAPAAAGAMVAMAGAGITPPPPPVHPVGAVGGKGGVRQASFSTPGGERVYIKGLPAGLTNETCREIFSPYGTVVDTKVLVNDGVSNDGSGQSVAIIRMASEPEAKWLVENLNGNMPEGLTRPIEVSFAGSKYQQSAGPVIVEARVGPYPAAAQIGGKGGAPMQPPAAWGPVRTQPHAQMAALPPPVMPAHGGKGGGAGAMGAVVPGVVALKTQVSPDCKLYIKGLPMGADDLYLYKVFSPWARLLEAVALSKGNYTIGFVTCLTEAEAVECITNVNGVPLTDGTTLQVSVKTSKH